MRSWTVLSWILGLMFLAALARLTPHVVDERTTAYIALIAGGGYCIWGATIGKFKWCSLYRR